MTKYLAALLLALTLFAPAAHGASFDCAKAGTKIERMICGDEELSKLDELLGDRYVRALKKAEDANTVKAEQRAWLRGPREACTDVACLKAAYESRIAELTKIGWMTKEKARAICERVAGAKLDRSFRAAVGKTRPGEEIKIDPGPGLQGYWNGFNDLAIDYDSDGKVEKLGLMLAGGSCQSYNVSVIADVTDGKPDHNPVRDLNWQEGSQDFLIVDGEPVLARTPNDPKSVLQLEWLSPAGSAIPLCEIAITHKRPLITVKAENPALCQAVAEKSVDFLPWENPIEQVPDRLLNISPPWYVNDISRLSVDIDLDGESDVISWVYMATMAGCGYGYQYLAEVSPDFASFEDSSLNAVLTGQAITKFPDDSREWNPGKHSPLGDGGRPQIFMFDAKPYILGRGANYASGNAAVLSLWGGVEHEWCQFQYHRKPSKALISMAPRFD
jgi:uncharacterized protein YecT (DUF1311 family)